MNDKTPNQIAAEAAKQIRGHVADVCGMSFDPRDRWLEAIIKTAIEKALAAQPDGMLSGGTQRMDESRAAQASDRKEGDDKCELTDGPTQEETSTHTSSSEAAPTFNPNRAAQASEQK